MNILHKQLLTAVFVFALLLAMPLAAFAQTVQVFTSSGSFTVPACVTSLTIQCFGAGGGGGGGAQQSGGSVGSGGGGGGYAMALLSGVSGTFTVTVGTGGTAGIGSSATSGGPGGNSTVSNGTISVTATGGGAGITINSAGVASPGGAGGSGVFVGCSGLSYSGGNGGLGNNQDENTGGGGGGGAGSAGNGGSSAQPGSNSTAYGGAGGLGSLSGGVGGTTYDDYYENGNPGAAPGGGGSAGGGEVSGGVFGHGTSPGNGAAGGNGKVVITYFTSTPTITSVTGNHCIGSNITIHGTLLANPTSVTIGGTAATVVSATNQLITCTIAPGTTSGTVTVTNSCGTATSSATFIVNPASPPVSLGTHLLCGGVSYTFAGHTYSSPGTYYDTAQSVSGCDSITSITLAIAPVINQSITQSICAGSSYSFGGNNITAGGVYRDTTTAASTGCDSITTLLLSITPNITQVVTQTICTGTSYAFGNRNLTTGGVYTDTATATSTSCDSITTLVLTLLPNPTSPDNQSICNGQSYQGHSTAGTYIDTFAHAGSNGCDSLHILNLTIAPYILNNISQSICNGQSYLGHTQAGTYADTLVASSGCDTIRTVTLTIAPYVTKNISMTVCAGQSYLGHNQSGMFIDTITAASVGCDTVRTINLTMLTQATSIVTYSTCAASYQGHTASGTYIDTLHGVATGGCDSIRVLQLNVGGSGLNTTINHSICEGQVYRGSDTATTFIDSLHSVGGCDSVVTTILTVLPHFSSVEKRNICQGESYQGHSVAGLYTDSLHSVGGCDSIIILELQLTPLPAVPTIVQTNSSTLTANGDSGVAYLWQLNGDSIPGAHSQSLVANTTFAAGSYTVVATDSSGCSNVSSAFIVSVGIAETTLSDNINIYPNPATGQFGIKGIGLATGKDIQTTVYDMVGIKVMNNIYHIANGQDVLVDISKFSPGIYMVQFQIGNQTFTKKLVVQ